MLTKRTIDLLGKIVAGDVEDFPYKKGPELVTFFNELGFNDQYDSDFGTRWVYASSRIESLQEHEGIKGLRKVFNALLVKRDFVLQKKDIEKAVDFLRDIIEPDGLKLISSGDGKYRLTTGRIGKDLIVEIINLVGTGYFCDVQKAKDENGRKVAVKQLKKTFVTNSEYVYRFKREIDLLERLHGCQYIVPCLDKELDEDNLVYRYMMPLADYNLYHYIRNSNNKISLEERIHLFDQVLEGMRYAHAKNLLHRDIAPNNVLLFLNGNNIDVKISDFGLGKDHESLTKFTKSVGNYGQQLYVAPEQFDRLKNATKQSDIYSLGKLLYFVITGRNPLTIQSGVKFQRIIQKAVLDNPEERFESIEEFIEQYESLKSFYLQTEKAPRYETMKQYLEENETKIDWGEFHRLVLKGRAIDHVFYDYLEPIVELFIREPGQLTSYISAVNESINDFLEAFIKNLHDCDQQTGWPFRYLNTFGDFFEKLHSTLPYPEAQLLCLKELWKISFEQNQWGPQKSMESLLRSKRITQENIEPFAEFLMRSKSNYASKIIENGRLSEIDPTLRVALSHIHRTN